jgi:hypothetical protein
MAAEPELQESADPRALVRGDPAAVRATVTHLATLATGCAATARGLDAIRVGAWTGAAAEAFRARHAETVGRWSRAAAAFRSAAQAWERFRTELVAAQEQAAAAVARFPVMSGSAGWGPVAPAGRSVSAGSVGQGAPAVGRGAPSDAGSADAAAARMLLADARARRDRAAVSAARELAAAAALALDPPSGGDRRILGAADWVLAHGVELGHVAEGVGEGVEDILRFARLANPADPYNLNHPGRFVANASTALAGVVGDVVHPLRQVTGFVGPGWGSDPARAYGHLLPTALLMGAMGASRSVVRASGARPGAAAPLRPAPLLGDPRPTARPFEPPPPTVAPAPVPAVAPDPPPAAPAPAAAPASAPAVAPGPPPVGLAEAGAVAAADRAAADRLAGIARRLPPEPATLMPKDIVEPGPHHDPERAHRARVTRADKDFTSRQASRGNRKSYLDEHGHLVPANPAGGGSVVEHVVGRRSRTKGDSPYSSFTAPGARTAVKFGGSMIEVDVVRLQADIDAGRVPDVEILPPHRVQAAIQADADRIAGRPVDLYVRKGRIPEAARSYGLDAEPTAALRQRMIDMVNAERHHEWMIRGVVPGRYIVGPYAGRSDG